MRLPSHKRGITEEGLGGPQPKRFACLEFGFNGVNVDIETWLNTAAPLWLR